MAKSKNTSVSSSKPLLFSTEIYSSGIGDIERSQYDPFWDEIILDSEITVIEPTGQTTLFYDSTIEPPLPEEFNSIEAYNAAHDSWCVNHPELVNHGFKKDSERVIGEDRKLKKQDKPEFKEGCVYRHSSGKKAKITKLFKTTGKCCVYLEGEIIQEKISLSELSELSSLTTEELVREKENQLTKGDRVFSKQLQRNGEVVHVGKSGITIDWISWIKLAYSFSQIEELKLSRIDYPCLPCLTVTQEQVQPQLLVTNSELEQPNLLKLTLQHSEFSNTDFQTSQSTQTSEIIKGNLNSTTFTGSASHAQEQVTLEIEKDLTIQNLECGSIPCERSPLNSLNLLLLNNPEELLTTDLEQFLEDSEWLSTVGKIQKSYQQRNSVLPTKEKGCSLLPTPTTYPKGSTGCRPAGTNRLEQKLRPFIAKGDKLHPAAPGWMMGFPVGWVEQVLADTGDLLSIQPPFILEQDTISTTAATVLISTVEPLPHNKQKLLSEELNILQNLQELETTTNTDNQTTTYNKPWYEGKFNLGDLVVWQKYPDLIYEIVKPEKGGHVVIELKSHSDSAFLRKRVAVIYLTPTNTDNQTTTTKIKALTLPVIKPEFKPGEYILNGRVGQIIEASLGEYFVVKYGDGYADLKCYFWGQDDELINSLSIAPQELVEKFLGENISEVSLEKNNLDVDEIASQKFLGENISEVSLEKKKKVASGSLAPYLEHKKVKDGTIVTYPKVVGDRDKNNPSHWKWGYYYEIKIDGEWKNRSISTPFSIVSQVKIMIECDRSVEEIKTFIMNNKIKKQKS